MSSDAKLDIRPRTTGEILDDAIRLALADAPLLLSLSGLTLVPAFIAWLLVLATPVPSGAWLSLALPALAALFVALTGIGSGACQELFRRRADDIPVTLHGCLGASLRRGLDHAAARGLVLVGSLVGLPLVIVPGLAVWIFLAPVHALMATGEQRLGAAVREAARAGQRNAAKLIVVVMARLAACGFLVLTLHIVLRLVLWVAGNLLGLEIGMLAVQFTLTNMVYLAVLILFAWWLLAPLAEACNFLLYVDDRVGYEGLDLWYRVQRLFPVRERGAVGVLVLGVVGLLFTAAPLAAADRRLEAVTAARREVAGIAADVRRSGPRAHDPGWTARLRSVAENLKRSSDGSAKRYAWFDKAVDEFSRRRGPEAERMLDDIDARLALIEESLAKPNAEGGTLPPDEIRKLLPEQARPPQAREKPREEPPPRKQADSVKVETKGDRGPALAAGVSVGGFGILGWLVLAGLLAAFIALAVMLAWQHRKGTAKAPQKPTSGESNTPATDEAAQPDLIAAATLWQQADELARQGQYLEAVRWLYLAVLALLHRARLIRYEKTRTNGEYVRQVRLAPEAPAELHASFGRLTRLFDQKWYGDRACEEREFHASRSLAEAVRAEVPA